MRCRENDLAVVVRAENKSNIGKIVRCLKMHRNLQMNSFARGIFTAPVAWDIEPQLPSAIPGVAAISCPDDCLRPLRDEPGLDEILRLSGLPVKETT